MEAELIAISEALSYLEDTSQDKIVILTDSKSSLQHLALCTSTLRGTPIAYTILDQLSKLQTRHFKIVLQWIPSHTGLEGNETVDALAKQAISDGEIYSYRPFYANFISVIKEECYNCWKEYFDKRSVEKGIWYRTIQPHPLKVPWFEKAVTNRPETVTALRLRSGHIPGNKFSYLMKKSSSPNCSSCNKLDDVQHILTECVRNSHHRPQTHPNSSLIGVCNSTLAEPLSASARILYKLALSRPNI